MSYWKGLFVAAVFDLVLIAGSQSVGPPPPAASPPPHPDVEIVRLNDVGRRIDSLMIHLQGDSLDVSAMEALAALNRENGWHDAAIGPLARALQLDPRRRSLWVALDRALEAGGRARVTDAELVEAARAFVEAIEMWGHGC